MQFRTNHSLAEARAIEARSLPLRQAPTTKMVTTRDVGRESDGVAQETSKAGEMDVGQAENLSSIKDVAATTKLASEVMDEPEQEISPAGAITDTPSPEEIPPIIASLPEKAPELDFALTPDAQAVVHWQEISVDVLPTMEIVSETAMYEMAKGTHNNKIVALKVRKFEKESAYKPDWVNERKVRRIQRVSIAYCT